jgi:hypothetical protein
MGGQMLVQSLQSGLCLGIGECMARAIEATVEFLKPSSFDALKLELAQLESVEPGSKSVSEAIAELMPLIKGCRDRGHSWNRICLSFQKFIPELSTTTLRRYVYELDPSLKGTVKGVNENGGSESVLPSLDEDETEVEDDDWSPSQVVTTTDFKTNSGK